MAVGFCFYNKWNAFHYLNLFGLWFSHELRFRSVCVKPRHRVLSPCWVQGGSEKTSMIPLFSPALITASGQCLDGSNRMATRMDVNSWGQGRAAGRERPWGLDIMLSFKEWIPLPLLKFFSGFMGESTIKWLLWGPITGPTHLFIDPSYSRKSCFLPGSWPMLCTSSWTCILGLTWSHFSTMVQVQKNPPISPRVQTSCSTTPFLLKASSSEIAWGMARGHHSKARTRFLLCTTLKGRHLIRSLLVW